MSGGGPPERPPKRPVPEPFALIKGRESSYVELSAQLNALGSQIADVLGRQNRAALVLDALGRDMHQRFDVLHEETALIRAKLSGDIEPRVKAVEARTPAQKAGTAALITGKWASYLTLAAVVARMLAKQFPEYTEAIEGLLGALGV